MNGPKPQRLLLRITIRHADRRNDNPKSIVTPNPSQPQSPRRKKEKNKKEKKFYFFSFCLFGLWGFGVAMVLGGVAMAFLFGLLEREGASMIRQDLSKRSLPVSFRN